MSTTRAELKEQAIEMLAEVRRHRQERGVAPGRPMSQVEFQAVLSQISMIGRITLGIDFARFINTCEHAETIGPIVDPTLFHQFLFDPMAKDSMDATKEMARGLLAVRNAVEQLIEKTAVVT